MAAKRPASQATADGKRKLRSGRRRVSPPPPPKRRPVQGTNVTDTQSYKHPDKGLPPALKAKKVSRCYVDFLNNGLEGAPNHAILRLVFQHPQTNASPRAPANTQGLKLELAIGDRVEPPIPGELVLKTLSYVGPHRQAVKTVELPMRENKTVRDFLAVVDRVDLLPCQFAALGEDIVGCRDFISQLIYHLNSARVLRLPEDSTTSIYGPFNHCYDPAGVPTASPVGRAIFNTQYHRININGINDQ